MLEIKVQHFFYLSPTSQVPWGGPPQSAVPEGDWERLVREGEWTLTPITMKLPDNMQLCLLSNLSTGATLTRCCWGRWTLAWVPPRWWWRSSRPAPACTSRCTSWRRLSLTGNFHLDREHSESQLDTFSLSHVVTLIHSTPPPLLLSTLQHHALLKCLAQCTEVTPYLLVMEFCPLVSFLFRHK